MQIMPLKAMQRFKKALLIPLSVVLLGGCATTIVRLHETEQGGPSVYPATLIDVGGFIAFCCTDAFRYKIGKSFTTRLASRTVVPLLCLADLPFSLATDTLFLPYDLVSGSGDKAEKQPNQTVPKQSLPAGGKHDEE